MVNDLTPVSETVLRDWSWGLARCMERIEFQYGPRDPSWMFVGMYAKNGGPCLNYPLGLEKKFVRIQLSLGALIESNVAYFEIAHEAVHLLNPTPCDATLLEEGVATKFSYEAGLCADWFIHHSRSMNVNANYVDAYNAVERLLEVNPLAIRIIRDKYGSLSSIDPEKLKTVIPGLDDDLAELLCERRQMRPLHP